MPIKEFIGPLVWWAYRDPHMGLTDLRPRNSLQPEEDQDDSPQTHLLFAWWKGCIEAPIPDDLEQQLEIRSKDDRSVIASRWSTLEKIWDDIRSARNAGPEAFMDLSIGLRQEDQPLLDKLPSRALLTRAQTALFAVSRCQDDSSHQSLFIVDSNGEHVGMIEGRDGSVTKPTLTESKPSQDRYEFMAISLSQNCPRLGYRRTFLVSDDNCRLYAMYHRLFTRKYRYDNDLPGVNVLLIGRTEESWLAHRIGVGWISLIDWCMAEREFKTIALE